MPTIVMSDNRPPFNGDEFRQFSRDFDFIHTTSSPHFHQSNSFIESMVKRKVKNAYKKMDGSPNAQARALLQLCGHTYHGRPTIPELRSSMDIQHKVQYFQDHPGRSIYVRSTRDLLSCKRKQKETVWQTPLSQRSVSPESERTSPVLPEQASHRPHQVDNRYCDWNIRMWMILHDPRPPTAEFTEGIELI